jgi:hypothetical protein
MKILISILVLLISISCTKEVESYVDIRAKRPTPLVSEPKTPPSGIKKPSYLIPEVKSEKNFSNMIYIDPDYKGTGSNGTIDKPYVSINRYKDAVPPNTAFLIKRGTTHEKIGRLVGGSHSPYTKMVFKNNFIGAYGTGERPVVEGFWVMAGTDDLTIRDLHIYAESQGNWGHDAIVYLHDSRNWPQTSPAGKCDNVTIAYCIIEGKFNNSNYYEPSPLPIFGLKVAGENFTLYNNIIKTVWIDGVDAASGSNHKYVKNWIYDLNHQDYRAEKEGWPTSSSSDPWAYNIHGQESKGGWGDGFQSIAAINGFYFAGNIIDRSDTKWKFCWITNAGWDSHSRNLIMEYNTFIAPQTGAGGAAIYFNAPQKSIFRYNLIDGTDCGTQSGVCGITSRGGAGNMQDHFQQVEPYGIRQNHIIRGQPGSDITGSNQKAEEYAPQCNLIFETYHDYLKYLEKNVPVGSDINTANFWEGYE